MEQKGSNWHECNIANFLIFNLVLQKLMFKIHLQASSLFVHNFWVRICKTVKEGTKTEREADLEKIKLACFSDREFPIETLFRQY